MADDETGGGGRKRKEGEAEKGAPPETGVSSAAPPAAVSSSSRIQRYEVGPCVSKTKFSTVYRSHIAATGEPVALKKIEIFDIMDPAKRQKILREADLIGSLDHPHIIRCIEHFVEDNTFHLVFDWAEKGDIKQLIRRARRKSLRVDERTVWRYLHQAADALDYMHSKRIMHRDIKPANLFLAQRGTLKVGDLGLGREFSSGTAEAFSKVGTPLYMSPETITGSGYDWKSDVWSLGCVVYELATLESPFRPSDMANTNIYAIFKKIQACDYRPMGDSRSQRLRNVVHSMIQLNPDLRPTAGEVRDIAAKALDEDVGRAEDAAAREARAKAAKARDGPADGVDAVGDPSPPAAAAAAAAAGNGGAGDRDDDGGRNRSSPVITTPDPEIAPPQRKQQGKKQRRVVQEEGGEEATVVHNENGRRPAGSAGSRGSPDVDPPTQQRRAKSRVGSAKSSRAGSAKSRVDSAKSRTGSAKSRVGSAKSRVGSARSRKDGNATPASAPGVPAVVVMETVLEKLRLLGYERHLPALAPISPVYFALGARGEVALAGLHTDPAGDGGGTQDAGGAGGPVDINLFADYCAVCAWALGICGSPEESFPVSLASVRAGDEDPREVATLLVRAMRDAGASCNFAPAALVRPGAAQCVALNSLLNAALRRSGFAFRKPDFSGVGATNPQLHGGDVENNNNDNDNDNDSVDNNNNNNNNGAAEEGQPHAAGDDEVLCPELLFPDTLEDAVSMGIAPRVVADGTRGDAARANGGGGDDPDPEQDPWRAMIVPRVSAAEWAKEVDRVAPSLRVIRVSASQRSEWRDRAEQLRGTLTDVEEHGKALSGALGKVTLVLREDLESLAARERWLSSSVSGTGVEGDIDTLRSLRQRLGRQEAEIESHRVRCEEATAQLAEINRGVEQARDDLDAAVEPRGDTQIGAIKAAIGGIKEEMRGMDMRIGILQNAVWKKRAISIN